MNERAVAEECNLDYELIFENEAAATQNDALSISEILAVPLFMKRYFAGIAALVLTLLTLLLLPSVCDLPRRSAPSKLESMEANSDPMPSVDPLPDRLEMFGVDLRKTRDGILRGPVDIPYYSDPIVEAIKNAGEDWARRGYALYITSRSGSTSIVLEPMRDASKIVLDCKFGISEGDVAANAVQIKALANKIKLRVFYATEDCFFCKTDALNIDALDDDTIELIADLPGASEATDDLSVFNFMQLHAELRLSYSP